MTTETDSSGGAMKRSDLTEDEEAQLQRSLEARREGRLIPLSKVMAEFETDSSERAKPDVSAVMAEVERTTPVETTSNLRVCCQTPPGRAHIEWCRVVKIEQAAIAACEAWAAQKQDALDASEIMAFAKLAEAERDAAQQDADALASMLREDAQHVHIIDHHQTRARIPFEECPSVLCSMRRELLAAHDARVG